MRTPEWEDGHGYGMKIIISFENRVRPDSTGVYFLQAAKQMGHEVAHVLPDDIHKIKPNDADFFLKVDDGLSSQVWNKELHPSAYYVIDTHLETDWRIKFAKDGDFDWVYTAQNDGIKLHWGEYRYRQWLPLACDPELHHVGEREKVYDGAFIGNFHTEHAGKRIDTVNKFFKHTPKPYFGNRTFYEMAEKYAQSKLVLNQAINGDVNMRFFEALCSGSCLVSDRLPDLERLGFVDGVHYAGYSSLAELGSVVDDLLANDEKREGIARNGRRIATQHTYAARVKTILEKLPKLQEIH